MFYFMQITNRMGFSWRKSSKVITLTKAAAASLAVYTHDVG